MARAADEYAVLHKGAGKIDTSSRPTAGGRGQGHSAPSSSGKNGKDSYREQRENQIATSNILDPGSQSILKSDGNIRK